MSDRYGAHPAEWDLLTQIPGIAGDILPVVSNPEAKISQKSNIKKVGKTPSHYNASGKVSGFHEWTSYQASTSDIATWRRNPDYGICIQTRFVRALDIDIEDSNTAEAVVDFIQDFLFPEGLPLRYRSNSGKCLLAFKLPGEFAKRRMKTAGGMIEFLAHGQQFIAAGTHPSEVRYEWNWYGQTDFPELTAEQFETIWAALTDKFAVEAPSTGGIRERGEDLLLDDEIVGQLTVLGWGSRGQAHIDCPFKAEHTTDTGDSSTSYFPRGTGGFEQGHFICLHAHCEKRTDGEFLDALDITFDDFDVIPDEPGSPPQLRPIFRRDGNGAVLPVLNNLRLALERPDVCDAKLAYDTFRDDVVITSAKTNALEWRSLTDNDYTILQCHLESQISFKPIALDLMRRAVSLVAKRSSFDSAQVWLNGLQWDGVPRVDGFMKRYLGTEDTAYAQAVSRYTWTALAGRVLEPGVKADMAPIWEGEQGVMKSTAVMSLVPDISYFMEADFNERDANLVRRMRGKMVGEFSELRGFYTKEKESIKAFMAFTHDEWVPKFVEKPRTLPRRILFIGTTNHKEILDDETGNRRWLPIRVENIDIDAIRRDRNQLWAEGREMFCKYGVCYREAEKLAAAIHGEYVMHDPWEAAIEQWLGTPEDAAGTIPKGKGYVRVDDVLQQALHMEVRSLKGVESRRVAKILRGMGFNREKKWVDGGSKWVWAIAVQDGSDLV